MKQLKIRKISPVDMCADRVLSAVFLDFIFLLAHEAVFAATIDVGQACHEFQAVVIAVPA